MSNKINVFHPALKAGFDKGLHVASLYEKHFEKLVELFESEDMALAAFHGMFSFVKGNLSLVEKKQDGIKQNGKPSFTNNILPFSFTNAKAIKLVEAPEPEPESEEDESEEDESDD